MATYSDLNSQVSNALAAEPAARQQFQTGLESQYGLPAKQADLESIRRSSMETDKLLADLPTQLKQRTSGMLMTSGQLGRLQSTEQAPLAQNLANLNRRESVASTGLTSIQQMIDNALAQRKAEVAAQTSELQGQRDLAFQSEEAQKGRDFTAKQAADAALLQKQLNDNYMNYLANTANTANTNTPVTTGRGADDNVNNLQIEVPDMPTTGGGGLPFGTKVAQAFNPFGAPLAALAGPDTLDTYYQDTYGYSPRQKTQDTINAFNTTKNAPGIIGQSLGSSIANALKKKTTIKK